METIKGTVTKIKVLKLSASPLIRFSIGNTNCLIVNHSLNFMYEVEDGCEIVVGGDYNNRHQFVVKRYCVLKKKIFV